MSSRLPEAYYTTRFVLEDAPTPLPGEFAIVTAFNPMDEASSDEENRSADQRLQQLLQSKGHDHFRATGQSPDGSHREPGWAINMPFSEAIKLSKSFRQRAMWWVEDDELRLVDSNTSVPELVDRFSNRVVAQ